MSWRWMSLLMGGLLLVAFHPCAGLSVFSFVQLFLVFLVVFVELSFRIVSQTKHILDAILFLSLCLSLIVDRGGVQFPGKDACWCTPV